nr:hypothetical protein [uncultured Desulfobacter sp.]
MKTGMMMPPRLLNGTLPFSTQFRYKSSGQVDQKPSQHTPDIA